MKRSYQDLELNRFSRKKEDSKLRVTIKHGSLETHCEGDVSEVVKFVFRFIKEIYPNYEVVSGLILTVDLEQLLSGIKGIISFLPKGTPVILKSTERLPDSDLILTHLVAAYAGKQIGIAEKDYLSMAELLDKTRKSPGTVAARLSELRSRLNVERVGRGEYRVTAYGIKEFMEQVLPKLEEIK